MKKRIVGLTGGVGSGKSTVLALLKEKWQAEVLQADALARELMEPGGSACRAVVKVFGREILGENGAIDRGKLAAIVFRDEDRRLQLNRLTHPLVRQEAAERIAASRAPLVVYEAALPREACLRELCGEIWYVHVDREERILRLMSSRGYSRSRCEEIMDSQMSEEEFRQLADVVIENGGTPEETEKQLQSILTSGILLPI